MVLLAILISTFPLATLVFFVLRYGVNVPFWDQWELVPLVEKMYTGTLSFADLSVQHNEHRLVVPKLLMLGLARISGWNIRLEMAASVMIAIGMFLIIWGAIKREARDRDRMSPLWLLPVVSVVIFSLSQWQNWLEGWQLQIFLCLFFVLTGFLLLSNKTLSKKILLSSLGLGTIAAYSFGTGLSFFPVGLLLLFLRYRQSLRQHIPDLTIWLAGSVAVFFSYFYQYHHPQASPPIASLTQLPETALYFFAYLGAPVSGFSFIMAIYAGMLGIGVCLFLLYLLLKEKKSPSSSFFLLALAVFTLCSAVTTAISRSGFSPVQAMSSRYTSITNLFWIAMLVLLSRQSKPYEKELSRVGITVIIIAITITSALSIPDFPRHATYLQEAADTLVTGTHPERLGRLYPNEAIVKERTEVLKKHHLSLFHK